MATWSVSRPDLSRPSLLTLPDVLVPAVLLVLFLVLSGSSARALLALDFLTVTRQRCGRTACLRACLAHPKALPNTR